MPTTSNQPRSSQSRNRAGSAARTAIIELLKDDHKRARRAFREFERLDADEDAERCAEIVSQCCAELTVHATIEEELLYPAARSVLADEDLVDEAEVEHATAKELIAQLQEMQPGDDKFAAKFTVLGEYIKHHVKEEETEMFPQLGRAKLDWQGLHDQMLTRREQLTAELMPSDADADDSDGRSDSASSDDTDDAGSRAASAAPAARKRSSTARNGTSVARKA